MIWVLGRLGPVPKSERLVFGHTFTQNPLAAVQLVAIVVWQVTIPGLFDHGQDLLKPGVPLKGVSKAYIGIIQG